MILNATKVDFTGYEILQMNQPRGFLGFRRRGDTNIPLLLLQCDKVSMDNGNVAINPYFLDYIGWSGEVDQSRLKNLKDNGDIYRIVTGDNLYVYIHQAALRQRSPTPSSQAGQATDDPSKACVSSAKDMHKIVALSSSMQLDSRYKLDGKVPAWTAHPVVTLPLDLHVPKMNDYKWHVRELKSASAAVAKPYLYLVQVSTDKGVTWLPFLWDSNSQAATGVARTAVWDSPFRQNNLTTILTTKLMLATLIKVKVSPSAQQTDLVYEAMVFKNQKLLKASRDTNLWQPYKMRHHPNA